MGMLRVLYEITVTLPRGMAIFDKIMQTTALRWAVVLKTHFKYNKQTMLEFLRLDVKSCHRKI